MNRFSYLPSWGNICNRKQSWCIPNWAKMAKIWEWSFPVMALVGFQVLRPWIGLKDERGPGQFWKVKGDHNGRGRNAAGRDRLATLALFPPWLLLRRLFGMCWWRAISLASLREPWDLQDRAALQTVCRQWPPALTSHLMKGGVLREVEAHSGAQWSFPWASKVQGHDVGAQRWIRHTAGPRETSGLEGAGSPCHGPWWFWPFSWRKTPRHRATRSCSFTLGPQAPSSWQLSIGNIGGRRGKCHQEVLTLLLISSYIFEKTATWKPTWTTPSLPAPDPHLCSCTAPPHVASCPWLICTAVKAKFLRGLIESSQSDCLSVFYFFAALESTGNKVESAVFKKSSMGS